MPPLTPPRRDTLFLRLSTIFLHRLNVKSTPSHHQPQQIMSQTFLFPISIHQTKFLYHSNTFDFGLGLAFEMKVSLDELE